MRARHSVLTIAELRRRRHFADEGAHAIEQNAPPKIPRSHHRRVSEPPARASRRRGTMNADGGVDPAHEVVVGGPGSPAFVGSVYYVAGADDVPVPEWPPQLPRAGILPSSSSSSSTTKTSTTTSSTSAPPPRTSKSLGASAYFLSKDLAERWRDVIRRPMGLRYCQRRRLFRPSDIPLGVVEVRRCSMGEAFGKLCVGWGNPEIGRAHV